METSASQDLPEPPACPNCGDPRPGEFCPTCGQSRIDPRRSPARWLSDVLADELSLGARLPRTLRTLLLRPGELTAAWIRGRRVRYVRPLRLYIAVVALFFAVTFFLGLPIGDLGDLTGRFERPEVAIGTTVWDIGRYAIAARMQALLTLGAFLLAPVFALWLTLVHLRRKSRVFADHLVFSLHQHTVFLGLTTLAWPLFFLGTPGLVSALGLILGAGIHTFLAYRHVYPGAWSIPRFGLAAGGWGAAFLGLSIYGMSEFETMINAGFGPARRYHAVQLWIEAQGHEAPEAPEVRRAYQTLALETFESLEKPLSRAFLQEWDAYRMADLELTLGHAGRALTRIEAFLDDHPDHLLGLGVAALAAAARGDSASARERGEAFLRRADESPVPDDSVYRPRFDHYHQEVVRLLGREATASALSSSSDPP